MLQRYRLHREATKAEQSLPACVNGKKEIAGIWVLKTWQITEDPAVARSS
jgi:hypothetical protein